MVDSDYTSLIQIKEEFVPKYEKEILNHSIPIHYEPVLSVHLFHDCVLVSRRLCEFKVTIGAQNNFYIRSFLNNLEGKGIEFEVMKK